MLGTKAILSASVGFIIAIVMAICIERLGGAVGGIISSVPTTILPTTYVFFSDSTKSISQQAESLFAAPIGIFATNLFFLPVWKIIPGKLEKRMKNVPLTLFTLLLSLIAWFVSAFFMTWLETVINHAGVEIWLFSLLVMFVCVIVGVILCWSLPPTPKGKNHVKWYIHCIRGLAAFLCICCTSMLNSSGWGLFAGAFSGFPAIFSTSIVSVSLAQGASVSTGAVGPMIIGGCAGGWYALLCGALRLITSWHGLVCIVVADIIVIVCWNVPVYFFIKWRRDATAAKKQLPITAVSNNMDISVEEKKEDLKDHGNNEFHLSNDSDIIHSYICLMEYEFCWNLAGREYSREKTIPKNEGILSRSSAFSLIFCCILFGNNEIPRSTYTNSPEFKIEPNNAK